MEISVKHETSSSIGIDKSLIYGEKEHTNFKMGYLIKNISPTALGTTQTIEDYNSRTTTLESDELKVSDDETELVFA